MGGAPREVAPQFCSPRRREQEHTATFRWWDGGTVCWVSVAISPERRLRIWSMKVFMSSKQQPQKMSIC